MTPAELAARWLNNNTNLLVVRNNLGQWVVTDSKQPPMRFERRFMLDESLVRFARLRGMPEEAQ